MLRGIDERARVATRRAAAVVLAVALVAAVGAAVDAGTAPEAQAADAYVTPSYGDTVVAARDANAVYHFDRSTSTGLGASPALIQTIGTGLSQPMSAAVTRTGHVVIADTGNARVLDVAPDGTERTVGSSWVTPRSVAVDGAGNAFVVDAGTRRVYKITPAGFRSTIALGDTNPNDGFDVPWEVAADAAGNAYIVGRRPSTSVNVILKVTPTGTKTILFETTNFIDGIAVSRSGDVYFVEVQRFVRKLAVGTTEPTTVFTVPIGGVPVVHLAMDASGDLLASNELTAGKVQRLAATRTPVTAALWLDGGPAQAPAGMGVDEWIPPFPTAPPAPPTAVVGSTYTNAEGFPTMPADAGVTTKVALAAGELPPGLDLVIRSGGFALQGTPTTTGTYTFTPELTNAIDRQVGVPITVTVVDPAAPGAPTIGTATAGSASATVRWTAPSADGGRPVTGYVVTPHIGGVAQAAKTFTSTATRQTITGLKNGTAYTFTVAAVNAIGTSEASAASNAVTPAGTFYLRNANVGGSASGGFPFGGPGHLPIAGDWDGDGTTTIGTFDPTTATFTLRNSNTRGASTGAFQYGSPGDVPLAGDWDGDGTTTIGVYRPSTRTFYLRNANSSGPSIGGFAFGAKDDLPVAGDWDGDGTTTIGAYRPSTTTFYLRDANSAGPSTGGFAFGSLGDVPVAGDWDGDGTTTIGTYRSANASFYLRNLNGAGPATGALRFGSPVANRPVVGDWDGNGTTTIGIYR